MPPGTDPDDADKRVTTSLVVDRRNTIVALGSGWAHEAALGEAEQSLAESRVLGKSLAGFIRDDATVMYVSTYLELCRLRSEVIYRGYRCDSPTMKRFMEVELTPANDGSVTMTHYLVREEPFECEVHIKDVSRAHGTAPQRGFLLRCSMCNHLREPGTAIWLAPEVLREPHGADNPLRVIHTVCEACQDTDWRRR